MPEKNKISNKKTSDSSIQKGLMNIYSNTDGSLPDISHLEVKRKSRWKWLVTTFVVLGILVTAIFWLSLILFNSDKEISSESIKVIIESQQSIASGDEIIYRIKYQNLEKVQLQEVEALLRYPDGFEFISSEPLGSNEFNTSWKLNTLQPKEEGVIEIKGKIIGEVDTNKILNVTFSYRPENFSSVFKDTTSFTSQITSSILQLVVEGPEQTLPEKKVSYIVRYKNNSEQKLEKIKILATYPQNFVFQEASPAPYSKDEDARNLNNQWVVENLEPDAEGEIEIIGGYVEDENIIEENFKVQLGFIDDETDNFSLQQEKIITTQLVQANLKLDLIVNGSTQNQPIAFGQLLTYSIVYKNLGQADLDDVEISIDLNSDVIDWDSLEDKNDGKISGNKITWTKDEISAFDLIKPLSEGTINFTLNVKDVENVNINNDNLRLSSSVAASLKKIGELELEDFTIEGPSLESNINTDIQLKVDARYFSDDNIAYGTGPLPPVVGQKTTFRIFWSVANSLSDVENLEVVAILPAGVVWENKFLVKTGNISYSGANNKVTWKISKVKAGTNFDDTTAWFDVSVTPTKQQEKKLIILTDQTELSATDVSTGAEIFKAAKATTSNLEGDPFGSGRGLVIDISE